MREIKFRAYSKSRNRYLGKGDTLIYRHEVGLDGSRWWASLVERQDHADEDIIVEQYTGLKDKNGKEIYEGDIVNLGEYGIYEVVFDGFWCGFAFEGGKGVKKRSGTLHPVFSQDWQKGEVIGNIHENPELLKKEENEIKK